MIVDLFAGGGGASVGIEASTGRLVDVAINHSPVAMAVHKANHPQTRHMQTSVWDVKPKAAVGRKPVELLWASPDCTHFSVAKGGKPREHGTRSLAWVVVEWARAVRPAVICLENVRDIGMRMLEPHELLAAQFGRFAKDYDLSAATTKAAKVRLIGNSVCPEVAEAVVAANVPKTKKRRRAA